MKFLHKLESIRGFAALYVVFHHIIPHNLLINGINIGLFFRFGQEAVILFFLLSGFVINYSFSRTKDKSFKTYFLKRFIRIYIPLILVYLISYVALLVQDKEVILTPKIIIGNIFMLQDVDSLRPNSFCAPIFENTPLWSLSYEWWFYMIYILLYKVAGFEKSRRIVFILSPLAICSYIIYPFFLNRIFVYLLLWWGGVELSNAYLKFNKVQLKYIRPYLISFGLSILLLLFNAYLRMDYSKILPGVYPLGEVRHFAFTIVIIFGAIVWQKFHWKGFNTFFGYFSFVAPISYVLYIVHNPLIFLIDRMNQYFMPLYSYIFYLLIVLIVSYFIEKSLYPRVKKAFI